MVDARFYRSAGERPISALLAAVGRANLWTEGKLTDRIVSGVGDLETACETDIAFATSGEFADALGSTRAGVILAAPDLIGSVPSSAIGLPCDKAQIVFSELSAALYPNALQAWVSGSGPAPRLEEGVRLGANVSIGADVDIGRGTIIGANSVIGPGVSIGRDCEIGPNCTV